MSFPAVGQTFTSIDLQVKNISSASTPVTVRLEVVDPVSNASMSPAIFAEANCGDIAPDAVCVLSLVNLPGIDITNLPGGSYKLLATVWIFPNRTEDQKVLFFLIQKPTPVPELSDVMVPLIAFSVLFLARKRE